MITYILKCVLTSITILVSIFFSGYAVAQDQVLQFDALVDMVHQSTRQALPPEISRAGSGFYVSSDGYAVTSSHNVLGCNSIDVSTERLPQKHVAKLIGVDTRLDLALLKIGDTAGRVLRVDDGTNLRRTNSLWRAYDSNPEDNSPDRFVRLSERGFGASAGVQILRYAPALSIGSSGGPIVNQYGEVRGVIISRWVNQKDNTSETLAVSSMDLARFLGRFGISYRSSAKASERQSAFSDEQLRGYLLNVFCSSR